MSRIIGSSLYHVTKESFRVGGFQLPVNLFDQFSGRRVVCSSVHPFVIPNNLSIVQWSDVNYRPLSEVIVIELNLKIKTFTMAYAQDSAVMSANGTASSHQVNVLPIKNW